MASSSDLPLRLPNFIDPYQSELLSFLAKRVTFNACRYALCDVVLDPSLDPTLVLTVTQSYCSCGKLSTQSIFQ